MKNFYSSFCILMWMLSSLGAAAQTTINTTIGSTNYTGANNSGTNGYITFVIENNSGGGIILTSVGNWTSSAHNGSTATLWYSATSLSGTVAPLSSPTWTTVASNVISGISSSTLAVNNVITGMNFLIPNGTQYRFALHNNTGTNYYSGTATVFPSPNTFTANGVTLKVGNVQISGMNVGYGATNNPRAFTGSITFTTACAAPTNVNVSGITANAANVTWTGVSGSQGYEYVVSQSATAPTGAGTPHATTNLSVTGLTQNTNYWVHVRNKCSATSFSSWVTVPFTTLTSCFPTTAVTVSNLTASTGTLFWSPVTNSAGYEYKIDQVATAPVSGWTTTTLTTVPFSGLTGGATYYAHVRNKCTGGDKSGWVTISFTMPVCDNPTNLILSNITDSAVHALWSMLPGASSYDYAVSFDKTTPTTNIQTTANIAANITGLQPNSKYYFHLRAKCFSGIDSSGWKLDSFVTKMPCYAPLINVNQAGTDNPYVFWDPVPTAIAYEYAVTNSALAPAFGNELYVTNVSINLEKDGKDYYVHVRAKCNSLFTFSPWSIATLRTNTTSVATVAGNETGVYPNPTKDRLYMKNVPVGAFYQMVDVTGRILEKGIVQGAELNVRHLNTGIYFLKIGTGDSEQNFRFIKQD